MRDLKTRRKLALKAFADELRRGISDEEFEGLAGAGSASHRRPLWERGAQYKC
jgi:hypothetical protein